MLMVLYVLLNFTDKRVNVLINIKDGPYRFIVK